MALDWLIGGCTPRLSMSRRKALAWHRAWRAANSIPDRAIVCRSGLGLDGRLWTVAHLSESVRFEAMFLAALPLRWRHPSALEATVPDCQLMPSMNSLLSFPQQNSAVGVAAILGGQELHVSNLVTVGDAKLFLVSVPIMVEGKVAFVLSGAPRLQRLFAESGLSRGGEFGCSMPGLPAWSTATNHAGAQPAPGGLRRTAGASADGPGKRGSRHVRTFRCHVARRHRHEERVRARPGNRLDRRRGGAGGCHECAAAKSRADHGCVRAR
jgi:hypothetical protein